MVKFLKAILAVTVSVFLGGTSNIFATVGLDPSGYSLYTTNGSVSLNNLTSTSITGNVRSETSTCTFNNLTSLSVTGSVVCKGNLRFNNISSGSVTGVVQSESSVTKPSGFSTGASTVVNSIGVLTMATITAPTSTTDSRYRLPITIVTGDYNVTGSLSLSGTIYATGDIHINNGSSITGTGTLMAGGYIHLNNVTTVGAAGSSLFLYALGTSGIQANNISSLTVRGTIYAPNGEAKINNSTTANVTGGIFGKTITLTNITNLTMGPGSLTTSATPPGIIDLVTAPAAPTSLVASSASFTSVGLSWTDNSTNETSFLIERSSNGTSYSQIGTTTANVTTYTDSGLTTNSTYYYRVRASNSVGNSSYTNIASATLLSPPNAPTSLVATVNANNTEIDLAWLDNSSNEASFRIERGTNGTSFTEIASTAANATSYSDTGLAAGTYYYRVRARNTAGDSSYTSNASGTITAASDPCDSIASNTGYSVAETYVTTVALCGILMK